MTILKSTDLFTSRLKTLLADYDRDVITSLYQPLVGFKATSLYFTLWSEANNQKLTSSTTHESLFMRTQLSAAEFIEARRYLEAIGLLKTFVEKSEQVNCYSYELYAPKTPGEFFDDPLLYGLLIKYVGDQEANRLKVIYKNDIVNDEGEDISASFGEVYHPDFNEDAFARAASGSSNAKSRCRSKVSADFSYEEFFAALKAASQLNESSFSKAELKLISKLATLYGVDVEVTSYHVANLYNPHNKKGERIDAHDLASEFLKEVPFRFLNHKKEKKIHGEVTGDSDLANKINLLEKVSPKDYLSIMQNGTVPAPSDLWLIYDLSTKYQLSNAAINVILDYVLEVKNNVLSRSLAEKIAASLARENISTAVDAMNYINDNINNASNKHSGYKVDSKDIVNAETNTEEKEENNSKENWDDLLSSLKDED